MYPKQNSKHVLNMNCLLRLQRAENSNFAPHQNWFTDETKKANEVDEFEIERKL
jgi:hypothetical protein